MSRLSSILAASLAAGSILGGAAANAAEPTAGFSAGDILARVRFLSVIPQPSSTITPIGGSADITNAYVPEVDFTYFATANLGFELIAATTRHGVTDKHSVAGDIPLGSVWLLPPTLTAQWHFLPKSPINPYVGAGINYTVFYNATKSSPISSIKYENGFGYAVQAGVDYNVSGPWYLNVDVKKIFLDPTVSVNGGAIRAKVNIDPWIVGAGIGYRF